MLKAGHFATINLVVYGLEKIFVHTVDAHRGEATAIFIGRRRAKIIIRKKMITEIIKQTPAPMDLREWPQEALTSLLEAERQLLGTHQKQLSRIFSRMDKEGDLSPYGQHENAWVSYNEIVGNIQQSVASKQAALAARAQFLRGRRLPGRKLNRKTKSKLRSKAKLRRSGNHRGKAFMPYTTEDSQLSFKPSPSASTDRPRLFTKKKIYIVSGNMYVYPPKGWPEIYNYSHKLIGSVEECFAFSGRLSPILGSTYRDWRASVTVKLHCNHGTLVNCTCQEATQLRYQEWLRVRTGELQWGNSRQFFRSVPQTDREGDHITPPDWPEGGGSRLGCLGERYALEGVTGAEGLNYRDWYTNNFYHDFGCGEACKCRRCATRRYKVWWEER